MKIHSSKYFFFLIRSICIAIYPVCMVFVIGWNSMLYHIHIIFYHTNAFTGKQGLCHNTPNGCHNSWSAYMIQNVNLWLLFSFTCTVYVRDVGNAEPLYTYVMWGMLSHCIRTWCGECWACTGTLSHSRVCLHL